MLSQDTPLVGREREQQQLDESLTAACAGQGRLVLVNGEAGIGKTTLVRDLVGRARQQGALVLSGGCYDLTTTPPYGPWVEAIRGYRPVGELPEIPSWFGNPDELEKLGSQPAIFEAAREFLVAISGKQPLLIVLEDLHWTDPASVDALRYLARTLRDNPILIVATYRDDEPYPNESLLTALPALVRESEPERLELRRWPEPDTRRLISGRYRLRSDDEARLTSHAHSLAEGNPFYTVELLRVLEGDETLRRQPGGWALDTLLATRVPPLIRQVIERRLDRLTDRTRGLFEFAAVIGHDVPFELWRQVSAGTVDDLAIAVEEALSAQLCDELEDRSGIRFRHALIRETLYAGANPLELRVRHRRIGEALALQPTPDPDTVAHHFQRAGDRRALDWLLRAGLRARRSAAWFTTIERFEQAAAMLAGDAGHASERGWLLYYAGAHARYINDDRLIESLFSDAAELASSAGDRELLAVVRWQRGVLRCHRGIIGDGLEDMEAARATLEQLFPGRPVPLADERIIDIVERLLSDSDPASNHSRDQPAGGRSSAQSMDMRWGPIAHWLAHAGHFERAISVGHGIVPSIRQAELEAVAINTSSGAAYYGLAISNAMLGRPEASREAFEAGRARAVLEGDYWAASLSALFEICLLALPYEADRQERRLRLTEEGAQIFARASALSSGTGGLNFCVFPLDYIHGRWIEMEQNVRPLINQPHLVLFLGSLLAPLLARTFRDRGKHDEAWVLLHETLPYGIETKPGAGAFLPAQAMQRLAVDLSLDTGDLPAARDWLEAHDRWLEWSGAVLGQAEGHLLWARYYLVAGDRQQSRERAEEALVRASDPRQPLALIAAHRLLGELGTQERGYESGGEHLAAATKLAEVCQAPYEIALTRLAQAELAAATRDVPQARHLLDRARETFEALGAKPALARARQVEASIATRARAYPAGLTPREVEVLCLVGEGMSNKEIADQLYLSVRTVERHITNIYAKIEVTNRVDAAAFVRKHRLFLSIDT